MVAEIVASRRCRMLALTTTVLAACVLLLLTRKHVSAHGGHDHAEIGEFDLDSPRVLSPETAKHIGLKVEEIAVRPLEEVLEIAGVVRPDPDKHRLVVSRVAGKLVALHVQIGAYVKMGDLLAEVDSPELARSIYEVRKLEVEYEKLALDVDRRLADVARLQFEIDALLRQYEVSKADYERSEKLSGEAISLREVESRRAVLAKAEGDLKSKKLEIEFARKEAEGLRRQADALRLSRAAMLAINNIEPAEAIQQAGGVSAIRAEMNGVVVARDAVPGQWVQSGEKLLAVADYSTVQISGELPESLIPRVEKRETQRVRVRPASDPATILEGKIKFIAPQLEPVKRTAHVIVEVLNLNGVLRGESWVDLAIILRAKKSALAVPKSAVVIHGPMHFVFLEIESGDPKTGEGAKYQKHDINPGLTSDLYVEVKDGVAPGDRVVTQGAYSLTQLRPKVSKAAVAAQKSDGHSGHSH